MTELDLPPQLQTTSAFFDIVEPRLPVFSQFVTIGDDNSVLSTKLLLSPQRYVDYSVAGVLFRIRTDSFEGLDALGLAMLCLENHYLGRSGAIACMSQVARLANTHRLDEAAEGNTTVNVRMEPDTGHVEVTWHQGGVHVDLPAYCMWPEVGLDWLLDLLRSGHRRNPLRLSEAATEAW